MMRQAYLLSFISRSNIMKTLLLYMFRLSMLTAGSTLLSAQVKIGENATSVHPSAVLELEKSNQGLLITRVALADALDQTTIAAPANSLLIYNTSTSGTGSDAVGPGFYYWDESGSRWKGLLTSSGPTGDVWIDAQQNLLSIHTANQSLTGTQNIALGSGAFGDPLDPSNHVIAIGTGACNSELTVGDAYVVAIGVNTAHANAGKYLNAFGLEAAMTNTGDRVNAIGTYAAYANTGSDVNAFGLDAAYNNIQSHINAFGNGAATHNTGFEINAFGLNACNTNTGLVVNAMGLEAAAYNAGNDVNAFGVRAAMHNQAGGHNLNAMGIEAAQNNTGGSLNAFGEGAGRNNAGSLVNAFGGTAGENNTGWSANMLGNQAGQFNTGAELNAMGAMAAQYNTHASVNAFGLTAAQYNQNADVNAMGWRAAQYNTGFQVNALGAQAARFNSGDHTIGIGQFAVYGDSLVIEGQGNIGIGYSAASNSGPGSFNICIGHDADIPDSTASHQINLGNQIIRESDGMVRIRDFIRLTPMDSPPATIEEGVIYYDANAHMAYVRTDTGWMPLW